MNRITTSDYAKLVKEYKSLCGRAVTNDELKRKIHLNGFFKIVEEFAND